MGSSLLSNRVFREAGPGLARWDGHSLAARGFLLLSRESGITAQRNALGV